MSRPFRLSAAFLAVPLLSFAQPIAAGDDPGVTVSAGASLRHRAPVHYPKDSIIAGTIEIEAKLNASGEVTDAHIVSGSEEFRKEALWSVLQWHYGADAPASVHISIRFDPALLPTSRPVGPVTRPTDDSRDEPDDFISGALKSIDFGGLSPEASTQLRERIPFLEGDPLWHSDLDRISAIVNQFDDDLVVDFTGRMAAPDAHRDLTVHIHAAVPGHAVFVQSENVLSGSPPRAAIKPK